MVHIYDIGSDGRPTKEHRDLNPHIVAVVTMVKQNLSIFVTAESLHRNQKTKKKCGFPDVCTNHCGEHPKEVALHQEVRSLLNEKVDLYALGNPFFIYYLCNIHEGYKSRAGEHQSWKKRSQKVTFPLTRHPGRQ